MTILAYIILGLVAGWLASLQMGRGGYGLIGDIGIGILGSIVGGWLATQLLGLNVTELNLTSVAIAVVGAIISIAIFRVIALGAIILTTIFRANAPGRSRFQFGRR